MAVCAQASLSQRATWPPSAAVRVAVGFEIAQALNAPLDIVLVRKIGVPWQPELALGAVTDGTSPETFIDRDMAAVLDIPDSYVQEATVRQLDEIERRRRTYCAPSPRCRPARCNRPGQGCRSSGRLGCPARRDLLVGVRARVSGVGDQCRAPAPNNRLG